MIVTTTHYTYEDLSIKPAKVSKVSSRSQCTLPETLPIFTAPMDTVVGDSNFERLEDFGIIPILPRTESLELRLSEKYQNKWVAYGLREFKENLMKISNYSLIDIAQGGMMDMIDAVREAKVKRPNLTIMVGNIANPDTYYELTDAGVDYVRLGIGAGKGCITTSNTGIHYPIASLIDSIKNIKDALEYEGKKCPKIIADGGIRGYSDVIKALALGADYVMIGSIFAASIESPGGRFATSHFDIRNGNEVFNPVFMSESLYDLKTKGINIRWNKKREQYEYSSYGCPSPIYRVFYGMASKDGQKAMGKEITHTAEGTVRFLPVKYSIPKWIDNLRDYLKSAMSYCGCFTLEEFIGKQTLVVCSEGIKGTVNK